MCIRIVKGDKMNINCNNNVAFQAKFMNTKSFKEVVEYAEKNNKLLELDSAFNKLHNVQGQDILIIHGQTPAGIYSSFRMGNRSVQNLSMKAKTPQESSFNAILELSELGRKFRKLLGGEVKTDLSAEQVISKYSVNA